MSIILNTIIPETFLDIKGDISSQSLTFIDGTANSPTLSSKSSGTRLVLQSQVSASTVDYALGIENNNMWYSVPSSGQAHSFYNGTTNTMSLSGTGLSILHGTASTSSTTGALTVSGGVGIGGGVVVGGPGNFQQGNSSGNFTNNQLLFGFSGTLNFRHAIKTRHLSGGNTANNAIDFYVWQTSDADDAVGSKQIMSVTSAGVGIGTSSPARQLDVSGTARMTGDTNITSTTESTSSTTGALVVSGGVGIGGNVNVGGNLTATTLTAPHSGLTGLTDDDHTQYALLAGRASGQTLVGGTGTGGNLTLQSTSNATKGSVLVTETTTSTSSTTGALVVSGGVGIGGNVNVGGTTRITNSTSSTSTTTGALTVVGGVGITGEVNTGGNVNMSSGKFLTYPDSGTGLPTTTTRSAGTRVVLWPDLSPTEVDYALGISPSSMWYSVPSSALHRFYNGTTISAIISSSKISILHSTTSTSSTTGALVVSGGVGIGGNVNVGGNLTATTLTAPHSGLTGLTDDDHTQYALLAGRASGQTLVGGTGTGGNLTLQSTSNATKGSVLVTETTTSTSSTTGALVVSGGVGIGGNVNFGGNSTIAGDLTVLGTTLTIDTETVNFSDNLIVVNAGPSGDTDGGLLVKRFVDGVSGPTNFAGMFYKESTDEITFALTSTDPGTAGPIVIDNYIPIRGNSLTLVSTTEATAVGSGGSFTTLGGASISKRLFLGGPEVIGYQGDGVPVLTFVRSDQSLPIFLCITGTGFNSVLRLENGTGSKGRIDFNSGTNGVYFSFGYDQSSTSRPFSVTNNTASTSTTTGALTVVGGVGVSGNSNFGNLRLTASADNGFVIDGNLYSTAGRDHFKNTLGPTLSANAIQYKVTSAGSAAFLTKSGTTYYESFVAGSVYFTGQHMCSSDDFTQYDVESITGLIVYSVGEYSSKDRGSGMETVGKDAIQINESLPKIKLTTVDSDKRVFGVITDSSDTPSYNDDGSVVKDYHEHDYERSIFGRIRVNSLGEGGIWVCDVSGNIHNGDYITSSVVPGYGKVQSDDLLHSYTVAKSTCSVNFTTDLDKYKTRYLNTDGTPGTLENHQHIAVFIGCTYHCG